ncbi:hypothetical protein [Thalassotalea profundi]|uniref:Uncharacterized protein n=1 Tax=Thalassotalea profundi TaxID=2036687 RepID=A0ABQ3IR00_9GAMM|nr:hypothetical protein [Thalassotalea profundi]GHE87453.1 hypothetical protein GCM10011501_16160 [Thalassotalea profundi]
MPLLLIPLIGVSFAGGFWAGDGFNNIAKIAVILLAMYLFYMKVYKVA